MDLDTVVLQSNDTEISDFTSKIGKEIIIKDEKDNEVVSHLLEYIEFLRNDKINIFNICKNLNEELTKIRDEMTLLNEQNRKLEHEHEVHKKAMQEQRDDFVAVLRKSSKNGSAGIDIDSNSTITTLQNILSDDEIDIVKNDIQDDRLASYSKAVSSSQQV